MPTRRQPKPKHAIELIEGSLWSVPIREVGYAAVVITRIAKEPIQPEMVYAYTFPRFFASPPTPKQIPPLVNWESACIGLLTARSFRSGRWTCQGTLSSFARADWPVPPTHHTNYDAEDPNAYSRPDFVPEWSTILTSPDEPTESIIAHELATREAAIQFPTLSSVYTASGFEKSLRNHFKSKNGAAFDADLVFNAITPQAIDRWHGYADRVRRVWPGAPSTYIPIGKPARRAWREGAWVAMPIDSGGFGVGLVVATLKPHERQLWEDSILATFQRSWAHWPTFDQTLDLTERDYAYLDGACAYYAESGRWRIIGHTEGFYPARWPWPASWYRPRDPTPGVIEVRLEFDQTRKISVDPHLLELHERGGGCGRGVAGMGIFEHVTAFAIATKGRESELPDRLRRRCVTPERIAAWKQVKTIIAEAIAKA